MHDLLIINDCKCFITIGVATAVAVEVVLTSSVKITAPQAGQYTAV